MGTSRLGNLLVEEGLLTEADRRTIKRECGTQGSAFAKSIVALGLLDEDELAAFLAERTSHPVAPKDLGSVATNAALSVVDRPLIERLEVVPLDFKNNTLSVAMADPLDQDALEQLTFFTGYRIRPVIATFKQIQNSLVGILPNFEPQRSTFEQFLRNHVLAASTHMKAQDPSEKAGPELSEPVPDFALDNPGVSSDSSVLPDDDFADNVGFTSDPAPADLGEKDSYGDFADSGSADLEVQSEGEDIGFADDAAGFADDAAGFADDAAGFADDAAGFADDEAGFADDDIETDLSDDMASETIIDEETDASFAEPEVAALPEVETEDGEEPPGALTSNEDIDALFSDSSEDTGAAKVEPSEALSEDIAVDSGAESDFSDDIAVEDITGDLADELRATDNAGDAAAAADDDIFAQASAELEAADDTTVESGEPVATEPAGADDDIFAQASAELAAAGDAPVEDNEPKAGDDDIFAQASAELEAAGDTPAESSEPVTAESTADAEGDIFAEASAELSATGDVPEEADASPPEAASASDADETDLFAAASAELEAAGELPSSETKPTAEEGDLFDQLSAEIETPDDKTTPQEPTELDTAAEEASTPLPTAVEVSTDEPAPIADLDEFDLDDGEDEPEQPPPTLEASAQEDVDAVLAEDDPLESFASSRAEVDDTIEAEPAVDDEIDDVVDEFEAAAIEETDAALESFANADSSLSDTSTTDPTGEAPSEPEPPAEFSDFDLDDGELGSLSDSDQAATTSATESTDDARTTDALDDLLPDDDKDAIDLGASSPEEVDSTPVSTSSAKAASTASKTATAASMMSPQAKIQATSGLNRALISLALVKDRPRAAEALIKALRGAGFQRGVLLDREANFLCEWQGDDPVQFEPQVSDYQSPGLESALGRLSEEWSDFTATTRDENLSSFEGWPATLLACRVDQTGVACIASRDAGEPDASLSKLATQVLKQASHHF